ncbi:MAG TPA: neutral/alkaline non-lysosomal ceramidase N-terminal domain-containing protein, partial [Gemmataceae bacterium]
MRWIWLIALVATLAFVGKASTAAGSDEDGLQVGFAEADITPKVGEKEKPVYMAGFGQNRVATGVHDPLMARILVLKDGNRKIAIVSVDLVGFFLPNVLRVREQLDSFHYVLVSSTHNHEGPDTVGLWGKNPVTSGVDKEYIKSIEEKIVLAVRDADKGAQPVRASIGAA